MDRSRAAVATVVLGVAGLVACASTRIATTNGSLASPTASGTASGGAYSSPLPGPAFSAPPGQHLRVTVAQGCPATMPWAITDVANPTDPALRKALAPAGAATVLICRYAADDTVHFSPGANTEVDTPSPLPVPDLRASLALTPRQAASLSALVAATSIAPIVGSYSCPSGDPGHLALIVLGYSTRSDVDLWYTDTGCQGIDNGWELAFEGGNASFWNLQGAIDALVAPPSSGLATPPASHSTPSASGYPTPSASP
jgi:hypothetical protein